MRLVFSRGDRQIGEVRLGNGELVGTPIWIPMVEARMEKWGVDAEEALRRLDGWSNGYLTATLYTDAAEEPGCSASGGGAGSQEEFVVAVETTVVVGVDPDGLIYRAQFNVPDPDTGRIVPVVLPITLRTQMPRRGEEVTAGPVHVAVPFDPNDPVSVFTWLRGSTDIASITGPDLTPRWTPSPEVARQIEAGKIVF